MRVRNVAFFCCISIFGNVSTLFAADPAPQRLTFDSRHMGTTFRIVLFSADAQKAETAAQAAFTRVRELDQILSDYHPTSELMRFCTANDSAPGKPQRISAELMQVLTEAQELARKSDGAFDVTIGPLSRMWRLIRRTQQLPKPEELRTAQAKVGWRNLVLDPTAKTAALKLSGMRLDLGGIAKGYAADAALQVLARHGFIRTLVAASGDIRVGDPPPGQDGWTVEIAPLGQGMPARFVKLKNAAVSTSGDLVQSVEIDGVRYSHVLDPKTGLGLTGFRSVTVIAPTATQSDGYSTAASLLPPQKALTLVESIPGAQLYMVVKANATAQPIITQSKNFPN
ncbi:MAG: FAD:protein FMN transferase [Bacteroidales bacterium]|nr:FAD:protein FMN transferase [Bacteroidales bacterium]